MFHDLKVARVVPDTSSAVKVTLEVPAALAKAYAFKPGQYLTFERLIDDEQVKRSYSICSAPGEPLQVGIKQQPDGRFSTFANHGLAVGEALSVGTPEGRFTPRQRQRDGVNYLCMAAGSGITPILSIIRATLGQDTKSQVTLLYGNKTTASMMFRDELMYLKNRYLERFHLIGVFSQEQQDNELFNGRIDNAKGAELIRRLLDLSAFDEFFLCGPESMVSEVTRGLRGEGVAAANIHYELFSASADDAAHRVRKHEERARHFSNKVSTVTVNLHARRHVFDLESDGENLLDRAQAMGLDVPYSCKDGVCATCKARIVSGRVDMDVNHALTEQEVASGLVLTCQSHPITANVELDYDV
ncbi:MAG: 2Fe-2S iron-sulfur cluster-binding protein [Gammaproteobacteria bacterium]|nr:2Fe-2S iron-sulfur cluster-binding protein [Gammaproteobacteria bacterium]